MTSWADTYRELEPEHKELNVEALAHIGPVTVVRNAALVVFDILTTQFDAPDFKESTLKALFAKHGVDILREVAAKVYVEPRIADSPDDRDKDGGLLFEELDMAYHNAIFKAIVDDFTRGGKAKAAPFPEGADGGADRNGELPERDGAE